MGRMAYPPCFGYLVFASEHIWDAAPGALAFQGMRETLYRAKKLAEDVLNIEYDEDLKFVGSALDWAHIARFDGHSMKIVGVWQTPDYGGSGKWEWKYQVMVEREEHESTND